MPSIPKGLPSVVLVLSSLSLPAILGAQVITGSIVGAVRDEVGGVIPGATVTISSPALLPGSANFVTNEKGQFRFPSLAPGVYGLNVSLSGFQTYDEQGLRVLVGGTLERNVALKLVGIAENITVTGERPLVNTKKSGHSTNYGTEQIRNIPVGRNSMFDLMKAAPGTSEANTGSSNVSAFGSSANENAFLLDGTDITGADIGYAASDPDPDVIQEIEILCVFATLELRGSFVVKPNHKTHHLEVVRAARKCIHFYFYYIDPEFGFMHVRIQSWFPFEIQVYINGREWLARQLDQRGVDYQRYENALLSVDDLKLAERLCERLRHRKWPRFLNALARRVNPWLPVVKKYTGRGYYWVIDECEVATDLMWKNRSSLQKILPGLFDHAVASFSANDVMRFLGRKLTGNFHGELVSDHKQRPEGRRVKHRIKNNWLKMYDKYSVLRVETTINNPGEFRVLRVVPNKKGRNEQRWMQMGKGVANFWRYLQIGESANLRYLDALASAPVQGKAVAELDDLCRPRISDGKCYPKLNPVSESDCALFRAVLAGEHAINGFRNRDLQVRLYRNPPKTPQEAKRRCARTSRLIRKLRGHHLLAKVPRTRLYRVTTRGYRIMTAALRFRSVGFPEQVDRAA